MLHCFRVPGSLVEILYRCLKLVVGGTAQLICIIVFAHQLRNLLNRALSLSCNIVFSNTSAHCNNGYSSSLRYTFTHTQTHTFNPISSSICFGLETFSPTKAPKIRTLVINQDQSYAGVAAIADVALYVLTRTVPLGFIRDRSARFQALTGPHPRKIWVVGPATQKGLQPAFLASHPTTSSLYSVRTSGYRHGRLRNSGRQRRYYALESSGGGIQLLSYIGLLADSLSRTGQHLNDLQMLHQVYWLAYISINGAQFINRSYLFGKVSSFVHFAVRIRFLSIDVVNGYFLRKAFPIFSKKGINISIRVAIVIDFVVLAWTVLQARSTQFRKNGLHYCVRDILILLDSCSVCDAEQQRVHGIRCACV